ncbi:hypothetical protein ANN_19538 [Periplaneta americana]|uniref:DDE Tnp4 domain-containing protein n=1 Tax=Periplaneta americana TaxID=6978 RepID=A0ABQ8SAD8_PERAM|nr:hypothetical protein ANN_19538 [Periplaneta americana]
MERGWRPAADTVILGDSGYPLKAWLIPPIVRDIHDRGNVRFLRAHKVTRRVIENSIGILKEKFPCLNYLRVDPAFACKIFNCCVTLCNFSRYENYHGGEMKNEHEEIDDSVHAEEQEEDLQGADRLDRILNYFRQ